MSDETKLPQTSYRVPLNLKADEYIRFQNICKELSLSRPKALSLLMDVYREYQKQEAYRVTYQSQKRG